MIGPDLLSSSIFVCLFRWTKSNCLYRMYHWVPQWGALLMPGERHRSRLRALISTITHLFDWFVRFLHWVAHVNTKHSAHQYKPRHTFFALICPPGAVTYFLADTFCSALQLWSNDVWLRNFHICIGASSFAGRDGELYIILGSRIHNYICPSGGRMWVNLKYVTRTNGSSKPVKWSKSFMLPPTCCWKFPPALCSPLHWPGLLCPGVKNEKWWQGAGTSQQELVRAQCKDRWHLYWAGTAGFFLEPTRPEQGTLTGLLVHLIVTAPAPVKQKLVVVVTIWRGNVAHAAISILRWVSPNLSFE